MQKDEPMIENGAGVPSTALFGIPIWNPMDHGLKRMPMMVPAHEFNRLAGAIIEALQHLETNYDIDGNSMADSDAATCLRRVMPNPRADRAAHLVRGTVEPVVQIPKSGEAK